MKPRPAIALLLLILVSTSLGAGSSTSIHEATPVSATVSYNTETGKYHVSGCRYWGCKNCVTVSLEEARRRGGVPCKVCN
jgi:hypothetical protein